MNAQIMPTMTPTAHVPLAALLACCVRPLHACGAFSGDPAFGAAEASDRVFYRKGGPTHALTKAFSFNHEGTVWSAPIGAATDGACLPEWARTIVPTSMEPAFAKAAILHDHHCLVAERTYLETHRMFFHALVAAGLAPTKAAALYAAIVVAGPTWTILLPTGLPIGSATERAPIRVIDRTDAIYVDPGMGALLAELGERIAVEGLDDIETLERLAIQHRLNLDLPLPAPIRVLEG
ncbi:DUF1353 domain-containing protein [Jannaschia aquimarina]|uniref:DUF1353 domain-containing protein n=1 Tax=Jannaschia aquimarina TaxID=935700 RepID=A0A0D1D4F1_9RHOB|nr:DUF1353 domain-containing protein [Jannaschia aquimarina]KIT14943.1 hypothetical protein jaqu_32680 [Jannaschia aquimarina]SNS60022.1 Protein of unknown function [Jannaschia aquimarina]